MSKNQKGFTLIEVVCSVALLAIIVTASASFFKSVTISQKENKEHLYANNIAQEILEKATRSGDLSTTNQVYTRDGYEYYVEITATARPDILGNSGTDINGDDSNTITENNTYKKGKIPPKGTNNPGKPSQTAKPGIIIKGTPGKYNFKLQVFDFIDEDMPMLIAAGNAILKKGSGDDYFTREQLYDILSNDSDFQIYNHSGLTAGGVATNIQKAMSCYRDMTCSDINNLLNTHFIQGNNLYGWKHVISSFSGQISSPSTFSGNMWLMTSTSDADKATLAQRMYDYLTCGDSTNMYSTDSDDNVARRVTYVCEYFENNILGKYSGKQVITGTGIPFFDGIEYETLTTNILKKSNGSFSGCVGNVYENLNKKYISDNHQGPCLLGKAFKNSKVCSEYDVAWSTKLWNMATVTLQVAGRGLQCSTFGMSTSWPSSGDLSQDVLDAKYWGVKVKDIFTSGNYYQHNILDQFCFYIDGGLSYRDLTVRAMFNDCGSWCWDDVNAPNGMHKPAVYYFTNLEYESEGASYELDIYDPYDWAADEETDRLGDDDTPTYIPPEGKDEEGEEATEGINHKMDEEDVIIPITYSISGMECYTITVRGGSKDGKILAELSAYGIPAKTPAPESE